MPAVEQAVVEPDGWSKKSRIGADGRVVVTLTSPDPVCPSEAKVEFDVKEALDKLRQRQAIRFCIEDLIIEDTDDLVLVESEPASRVERDRVKQRSPGAARAGEVKYDPQRI